MHEIFENQNITPMLIGAEVNAFDDPNFIYELKLDGARCLMYITRDKVILRNKRNKDVTDIYPELLDVNKTIKKNCILDGELIVIKNNKPDFSLMQKRSLMTDKFKINLSRRKYEVTFVAFDILFLEYMDLRQTPLIERKEILNKTVKESNNLVISRYIEHRGIDFYNIVKKENLEGIVGKNKFSLYKNDSRTKDWKKIKFMQDEDLIICGYEMEDEDIKYLILGYYDHDMNLKSRGKIYMGVSKREQKFLKDYALKNEIKEPWFKGYGDEVIWLKLKLVGRAHYMHKTENGNMRHPIWKGIREDKEAIDCVNE